MTDALPDTVASPPSGAADVLADFHPAVRGWFEARFPDGPSAPQRAGWPAIARGEDTLIAAPTGTGKTLAAFLVCIDRFFRAHAPKGVRLSEAPFALDGASRGRGAPALEPDAPGIQVVYVSPLKALAADIQTNLETPLREIRQRAAELGWPAPELRVGMRSGDTPASQRAAMLRKPPHLLVTTPESLYLMLTAEKSRELLRGVHTLIVDEIHALARDKRGSHLALSMERLDALVMDEAGGGRGHRPVRIGLSATQRPIETVARLLVGVAPDAPTDARRACTIVDEGHRRALDLALEMPESELEAIASAEQTGEMLDRIAGLVKTHTTTLVFVNTRRMAERIAHQLAERLGEEGVAAHHGSLSKKRRLKTEQQLRAGELRALVATASLELGIDVGPVDLVCQIGSPRSLATFLQRVGRSGHFRGGLPKGRLFPMTRDELVECAGLLRGVAQGRLDALRPPVAPLDILAQQIVAACAVDVWREDALFALFKRAAPFAALERRHFDEVVELLSEGIATGRGRRAAWLHRDRIHGELRGRRGARLAALTSGGAIPDLADYKVVADPDETFIGTVGEDWAIESMAGDIFLLGSTSWRIRRVEAGVVRVEDAKGAPPTVPFWVGEAPARTEELSAEVSAVREAVEARLARGDGGEAEARAWLEAECGLGPLAAQQLARYLAVAWQSLGALPTRDRLVFERFFDDTGGMQLVVHSPLGGRLNRALCFALRKKFCKTFNFELQAAANDDAMVLSLGPQHSFPLQDVPGFLKPDGLRETLQQAVIVSPLFQARWRWNLSRALAILRFRGGRRNPPPIQRMEADDLMAAIFPQAAACQENVTGPIEIPDHPIVRQTFDDCLTEAMDYEGLVELVRGFSSGAIDLRFVDTTEPSPLCHEILSSRPYTFLDDAPLEERRTRAVRLKRGLPLEERDLARLDPQAVERVRAEARPEPRDEDELHDLLLSLYWMPSVEAWRPFCDALEARGRVVRFAHPEPGLGRAPELWAAVERVDALRGVWPGLALGGLGEAPGELESVVRAAVRGHVETSGPVTIEGLAARIALPEAPVEIALAQLEAEGHVLRGRFTDEAADGVDEFCARRLLERMHAYTQVRLRKEIEPVSAQDFMRFLLDWQHVKPGTQLEGPNGVARVIEQLQGLDLPAAAWEKSILPSRVKGYRSEWLDGLCLSGQVAWGRLAPPERARAPASGESASADPSSDPADVPSRERRRSGVAASRATPLGLLLRGDLDWLLQAHRGERGVEPPADGIAAAVYDALNGRGALFHAELVAAIGRLPVEVEEGLWELVARGLVGADGFQAVRALLGAKARWAKTRARERARRGLRRGLASGPGLAAEGRWSLLPKAAPVDEIDVLAEALAEQLLARWGVVFKDLLKRENLAVPWREVHWALRRMEARGQIRGGRFVSGFVGEQFARPEAVDLLRSVRRRPRGGAALKIAVVDPLNLVGIVVPGARVPAVGTRAITWVDGLPSEPSPFERRPPEVKTGVGRRGGVQGALFS